MSIASIEGRGAARGEVCGRAERRVRGTRPEVAAKTTTDDYEIDRRFREATAEHPKRAGGFGCIISRLFRHTILPSVAESANWPRGFVPDRHSSSTDVGWWHRPAGRLRRSTFHSHHLHPSTPHVKNGCFRCYHPLPQGPSARSAANRRLASRSPVASRGSRGNSIRARVPEKKALSAPIAPGDGPDGAMRGPANRTIQLCGRSLTSSHLLFPPQVEFRGQTAGLKRGKAVKVRRGIGISPTLHSTRATRVPDRALARVLDAHRSPRPPPRTGRRRQHHHRG